MSFYGKVINYIGNVFHKINFMNKAENSNTEEYTSAAYIEAKDEATEATIKGDEWIQFESDNSSQNNVSIKHKVQSNSTSSIDVLSHTLEFDEAGHLKEYQENLNVTINHPLNFDYSSNKLFLGTEIEQ